MPGLNICYSLGAPLIGTNETIIFENQQISISKSKPHASYPISNWEDENFIYITEGFFYDWVNFQEKIEAFATSYFSIKDSNSVLKSYFKNLDAEFVIVIYNKRKNSTIIVNDTLGRLPLYVYEDNKQIVFTRNAGFLKKNGNLSENPQAILEGLVFGFSLDDETIYKNVKRVPGGSVVTLVEGSVKREAYHSFNYEEIIDETFDIRSGLNEIQSLFIQAIKNRTRFTDTNLIGLSGGLDSRAVVGGFKQAGINCELITFSDSNKSAKRDVVHATKIAKCYQFPWTVLELPEPSIDDFNELFELKLGLSSVDMSFLLNFYRHICSLSDLPGFFSGDGGDKVFPDLRPNTFSKSSNTITNYLINANADVAPALAANILGTKNVIKERTYSLLASYPERNWQFKYIHFIMENRVRNWLVEGEDRTRCFLNSFTPFYHIGLYSRLMSIPPDFKKDFRLYSTFLDLIAPESVDIANANWGFNISETKKIQYVYFKQKVKNTRTGMLIKKKIQGGNNYLNAAEPNEKELFLTLLNTPLVTNRINSKQIQSAPHLSGNGFHYLLTIMKAITLSHE